MGQEGAVTGRFRDLGTMLEGTGMRKVARIDTGLRFENGFEANVDDFVREFGPDRIDLLGRTSVAEGSYERAKGCLLAAQMERKPTGRRFCISDSRDCTEPMHAFCRMIQKEFLSAASKISQLLD